MVSSQSQLNSFNKKCFKLSRFCPRFLLFIFSRHNTILLKSYIIISLLTLLWPINTKSEMLTTSMTRTGFELSVSRSGNAIYFCIIAIPKKSHFTIFVIQNFMQNTKKQVNSIYIVGIVFVR